VVQVRVGGRNRTGSKFHSRMPGNRCPRCGARFAECDARQVNLTSGEKQLQDAGSSLNLRLKIGAEGGIWELLHHVDNT
jgi:hypothetical protein